MTERKRERERDFSERQRDFSEKQRGLSERENGELEHSGRRAASHSDGKLVLDYRRVDTYYSFTLADCEKKTSNHHVNDCT